MTRFDAAYEGVPPWDIGRPQEAVVRLAEAGDTRGAVLDAGCGTGENTLYLARRGHNVTGIDSSERAIAKAREKAAERGLRVEFIVADALELPSLGRVFDTVVDCGLFHVFTDDQRIQYVDALRRVVRQGGVIHLLCFSELEPGDWGPRRVTKAEIRAAFERGWAVRRIRPARFHTNLGQEGVRAWQATIRRIKDEAVADNASVRHRSGRRLGSRA